jgi:hypothetical protein
VIEGTGPIFKFQGESPQPGELKGCVIRLSRGIALHGVSTLVLKLPWPSNHVCNGETWKLQVWPGTPRRSFPKEKVPDCSPKSVEKNPVKMEKKLDSLTTEFRQCERYRSGARLISLLLKRMSAT